MSLASRLSDNFLASQFLLFQGFKNLPTVYAAAKHLSKSHPLTKKKGLQTIINELAREIELNSNGRPDYAVECVLYSNGLFDYLTVMKSKLIMDLDRNVRLLSWRLLDTFISIHPDILKAFSDRDDIYLEHIISYWFLSMHDVDQDIAQVSRDLFQKCLSPKNQMRTLQQFKTNILSFLITNFNQSVSGLMQQLKITELEEAEEIYSRLITMSLAALKTIIFRLPDLKADDSQLTALLSNKHFWKYLIIDGFPTIRATTFQLVGAVCEKAPQILEPHLKIMAPLILSCFQDQNLMVQQFIIEALLVFLKKYPISWKFVNVWSVVFPKLFNFLRNTQMSHPSKTFNILLPFVSMLSFEILGSSRERSINFFEEYFSSMLSGYLSDLTQDTDRKSIVKCYIESIMFVLMKAEQFLKKDDPDSITIFHSSLLPYLGRAIDIYLESEKIPSIEEYAYHLNILVSKFTARQDIYPTLIEYFWKHMKKSSDIIITMDEKSRNMFINRLDVLLSEMKEKNPQALESKSYLDFFGKPLIESALHIAKSDYIEEASFYLDIIIILCDAASLSQYTAVDQDFFENNVISIFKKFENECIKNESICESLCDFLSHYFESSPTLSHLEYICSISNDNPVLLFHIILKCFPFFQNISRSQAIENLIDKIVTEIDTDMKIGINEIEKVQRRLTFEMKLVRLILIDFPHVLSKDIHHRAIMTLVRATVNIQSLEKYTFREYREYTSIIIDLLNGLINEGYLKQCSESDVKEISMILLSLCLIQNPNSLTYISKAFFEESVGANVIDVKEWEESNSENNFQEELHIQSRKVWRNLITSLDKTKDKELLNIIRDNSIQYLQNRLFQDNTQLIAAESFVSAMSLLNDLYIDEAPSTNQLLLNKKLWRSIMNSFNGSVASMEVDGRYFLVSNIDSNDRDRSSSKFQNVLNCARFSSIIGKYMDYLSDNALTFYFLKQKNEEGKQANIWLLYYIIYITSRNILFHKDVISKLEQMEARLLELIWSSDDEEWKTVVQSIIENIIHESMYFDQGESLFVLKIFLRRTLNWLYMHTNSKKKVEWLFDYCLSKLLFSISFEEILKNSDQSKIFSMTIESLFSIQSKDQLNFVSDHFNRRLVFSETFYSHILEWYSKSVAMLSERTIEVVQETLNEQENNQLCNLLQIQSSLALLNDYVSSQNMDGDESRVTTQELIQALSLFTRSMMDSYEYCNTVLWQIERYIASMFVIIFKNLTADEIEKLLPEDEEEFISHFFQQHAVVVISSFDKKESSFDQLKSRLQNFAIMEEMATSFLAKRSEAHSSFEISRLLYYIMMTFFSYEKEMRESSIQNLTFFSIIKRLQRKVCTSLRYVTESIYTNLDHESKGNITSQMLNVLGNSENPYALLAAAHSLRSYQNLSNLLKESDTRGLRAEFESILHECPIVIDSKVTESTIIQFSSGELYKGCRHKFYAYLLSWDTLTRLCDKSPKEMTSIAFQSITNKQSHYQLLNCIFSFILHSPSEIEDGIEKLLPTHLSFEDISKDDPSVALSMNHEGFTLFSAQLILKLVHTFPALVRAWFKNSVMTSGVQKALTDFISQKLSPPVVEKEIKKLQSRPHKDQHVKIIVTKDQSKIRCLYTQDEVQLDLTLEIPPTYPLKVIEMKSNSRTGVSESKWRQVILKMTIMLFKDAGNIYDCIRLWIDNLDKHFSGWEACPICYAVLDAASSKVPDKKCSQCKQKFHSPCLLKWFSSTPEPTCPYCRGVDTFRIYAS